MQIKDGIAVQEDTIPFEYSDKYWQRYMALEHTPMSIKLNKFRCNLVEHYCKTTVLDIGIGYAEFMKKLRINCVGYDINSIAVQWLKDRDLFFDPYLEDMTVVCGVTMWDVIEHMADPTILLNKISGYLFISTPIFDDDFDGLMSSKHFKPNEHVRYFTIDGLVGYVQKFDFKLISKTDEETKIGRESIMTFTFQKNS